MSEVPEKVTRIPRQLKGTVIVSLLIGALTIVGWVSVNNIFTIKKQQSQILTTAGLERQVSELRGYYLESDPASLSTDLQQAENLLIRNFTHLAEWAQSLQEKTKQWNLDMEYRIANKDRATSGIKGIVVVPLEIQVRPQENHSVYLRSLQLIKALTQSGPKVEIRNMTILGNGQKATHLTIGVAVWMKNRDFVEL